VGSALVVMGLMLILSPLLLGASFSLNKYLVALGFVTTCLGASFLLNGAIDLVRRRRGNKP
jgi:hypothetical protein